MMHSHTLTMAEINRLLEEWNPDVTQTRGISMFLEQFGPSDSAIVRNFFLWVCDEVHGEIEYVQLPEMQSDSLWNSEYRIHFPNHMDLVAFILKYSGA